MKCNVMINQCSLGRRWNVDTYSLVCCVVKVSVIMRMRQMKLIEFGSRRWCNNRDVSKSIDNFHILATLLVRSPLLIFYS